MSVFNRRYCLRHHIYYLVYFCGGGLYHHPPFQSCLSQRTAAKDTMLFMSAL